MATINHLFRRGATYYWRARLRAPHLGARCMGLSASFIVHPHHPLAR